MPVTSQPTDQPYGQVLPDEKALERVFRASYAKWLADAKGRLGDAASAAPRVVSKAFHLAWQDRKRFNSMAELDAFIGANIHHGAARELSRRAGLHRMEAHEGVSPKDIQHKDTPDLSVDEAWNRLQQTLQGVAPESQRARASTARHGAAEHMADLGKERNWMPMILIGVVGLIVAVGGILWINKAGEKNATTNALAAQDVRPYNTGIGQAANVTLDDGTVVHLGPDTKLTVPKQFNIGIRAVKIEGTASFEVTQVQKQPFEVRVGDAAVLAHGTVFTVRKYNDESQAIVSVKQGSVDLVVGDSTIVAAAGKTYAIAGTTVREASAEETQEATTWADGNVSILGHDLRFVIPALKRWYGMDIHVQDTSLLSRGVFVVAPLNSPKEAIASVEKSAGVHFTYIGENMAFEDTAHHAAPARRRR
jgi:ferric-dicitrate binding protein FerR (iron transport regulator)